MTPFAPGDRIFPRTRPLSPSVTVVRCDWHSGGWLVHWEDRYHPDCTPVTGCGPTENWVLDTSAVPVFECDCCTRMVPQDNIRLITVYGIETAACAECRENIE